MKAQKQYLKDFQEVSQLLSESQITVTDYALIYEQMLKQGQSIFDKTRQDIIQSLVLNDPSLIA